MDALFDNLQNTQRIRYEAFATFSAEVNKCNSYPAIAVCLSAHIKFILDSFIFRVHFRFDQTTLTFEVFRGSCAFSQNEKNSIVKFENQVMLRDLPITITKTEIEKNSFLNQTLYNHPKVYSLSLLPTSGHQHKILVTNALRQDEVPLKSDFKFLRLISDLLANKLSQLFLSSKIERKNQELEQKNNEITVLNQTLEEKVSHRTAELEEANLELQTLFYRTSHDFKAPLSNILGLVNLGKLFTDDEEILSLFNKCKTVVIGLDNMLLKLNTISTFDYERNFEEISFLEINNEITQKFKKELTTHEVAVNFTNSSVNNFLSHKGILLCIFENLLENAICFRSSHPAIDISIADAGPGLLIRFVDNGIGILPEIKDKIFDMYYRGNERSTGTGLGLYVVKKLVKILNGKIEVESIAGAFAAFNIKLPSWQVNFS